MTESKYNSIKENIKNKIMEHVTEDEKLSLNILKTIKPAKDLGEFNIVMKKTSSRTPYIEFIFEENPYPYNISIIARDNSHGNYLEVTGISKPLIVPIDSDKVNPYIEANPEAIKYLTGLVIDMIMEIIIVRFNLLILPKHHKIIGDASLDFAKELYKWIN